MQRLSELVALIAVLGGMWFLGNAIATPYLYSTAGLSAIQATQLYSMGSYNATVGIGCFALAAVALLSARRPTEKQA